MSKKFILSIIMLFSCNILLFAQTNESSMTGSSITIGNTELSLEQAIGIVLNQNLTLQSAKYDVIMSDTAYEKNMNKYGMDFNLEGGYLDQETPPTGSTLYSPTKLEQWDAAAYLSKKFETGTVISGGIKETYMKSNASGLYLVPNGTGANDVYEVSSDQWHQKPSLFVSIQQELLKNAFGFSERKQNNISENSVKMQRAAIINQLSGLVVSTLTDYWNITIQKSAVNTAQAALDSNKRVRDIIARNAKYGLSEAYDMNQYNSLVANSESNLKAAEQRYHEAVRKLLRTMNMPPETSVTGVTNLVDDMPVLDEEDALKTAFAKRVDYKNAELSLENAKMDLGVQENGVLPSLMVSLNVSTQGSGDTDQVADAHNDAFTGEYPTWQARAKLTYPLDNREAKANLRNSNLKYKQAELNLKNIKLEIRDDIINKMEQVKVQHEMLMKARTANSEAELYYQNVLKRFEQGKVTSVTMKIATDYMVQSRQQALNALVQYNVTLLLFDLAKNEIFERYHVDVEKYLKNI